MSVFFYENFIEFNETLYHLLLWLIRASLTGFETEPLSYSRIKIMNF